MVQVVRHGIRGPAFELGPDKFVRVELRRIAREPFNLQPGTTREKSLNGTRLVDRRAVPEQEDGPTQMAQEVCGEGLDLKGRDVVGMASKVEGHAMPCGRDGQGRHGRELGPAAGESKNRGVCPWGPGAPDAGDEQEPGFIEEDQMGATSLRVFLYAAIGSVSNAQ